jgi:tetratricopeptide (TPR) repeat protein
VAAVAAVIGRRCNFTLLRAASGVDEHHAAEAVEEMVRERVLQAVGDQLDFTHDRVREVAYGRLLPPRRRLLHRAVVEALEAMGRETPAAQLRAGLDEHVEQLAHHAIRGELWEQAVRYLRHAGDKAAARSALHDARAWFEQALGAVAKLPESRSLLEQAFEIRLELRPVLTLLGEVRQTLDRLREAESLPERLDDDPRRGRVYALLTNIHAMVGELDEALLTGTRALDLARRLGDVKLRVLATTYLEVTLYYLGMPAPPPVYDRGNLVVGLAELGRFAEAATHEAATIRLAELTQHAYTVGLAARTASVLHLLKSDWATALSRLEHGIAVLRTANVPLLLPILVASSAWALAQLGKGSEALSRLREGEQLLEHQAATGLLGQSGWVYHALGRACLVLGKLDEARRLGNRALESSPCHPGFEGHARHLLGDVAARFDAESGTALYRQALALAEPRGMRPLVAHCHFGLGNVSWRTGQFDEAREHLITATAMYREMDMRFWLERAEARMGELT